MTTCTTFFDLAFTYFTLASASLYLIKRLFLSQKYCSQGQSRNEVIVGNSLAKGLKTVQKNNLLSKRMKA